MKWTRVPLSPVHRPAKDDARWHCCFFRQQTTTNLENVHHVFIIVVVPSLLQNVSHHSPARLVLYNCVERLPGVVIQTLQSPEFKYNIIADLDSILPSTCTQE